jgi:hypothetical protein
MLLVGALCLAAPALAKLAMDKKPPDRTSSRPERGGLRVLPSGPFRLECSQFGQTIIAGEDFRQLRTGFPFTGWLSAQGPGNRGRVMVVPLGDGATTCVLSP